MKLSWSPLSVTPSLCSGGCGRTGTYIAISILIERLKTEGVVDVFQTVRKLRLQRPGMVASLVRAQQTNHGRATHYKLIMTFYSHFFSPSFSLLPLPPSLRNNTSSASRLFWSSWTPLNFTPTSSNLPWPSMLTVHSQLEYIMQCNT